MLTNKIGYSYNDITIVPNEISTVSSRSECNCFDNGMLPIFTAPMASVVSDKNFESFYINQITPIIPRNISLEIRKKIMKCKHWVALSLKEFEDLFIENAKDRINENNAPYYICVDIANGHMNSLYEKCKEAKKLSRQYKYGLILMTGNIANAKTYEWIIKFNDTNNIKVIDYIRVGIGGGSGCITTSNVSIHYPQASLIDECYKIKRYWKNYTSKDIVPKIVADGGIRNYDHVIKALALGADYVMIGSLFAQCEESAGEKIKDENGNKLVKFFGMASADGQKSINGKKTKTAEGITKYLPMKFTLTGWTENMISYLRSAMSYCDCKKLEDFIGTPELIINSISEIQAVNK